MDAKQIEYMLKEAVARCAMACTLLNEETKGNERGPDCARKILADSDAIVQMVLASAGSRQLPTAPHSSPISR